MADSQPPTPSTSSTASTTTVAVNRKRRRTRSHNSSPSPGRGFFVPGFENAAGHKMMSISELMDTARGVTNMYLAHEIAVDKDFMLEKLKPDVQPGSMEEQVKTIVHQAFWDVLASELLEEPPIFNQVCFYFTTIQYVSFSDIVFKVMLATYVSTHPPIVFCALVCINQGHLVFSFQ